MTTDASKPASGKTPAGKEGKKPPPPPHRKPAKSVRGFFGESPVTFDIVANEQVEHDHHKKLTSFVFSQSIAIAIFAFLLIVLAPFTQPIYHYYARDPVTNQNTALNPLLMPNMTNRAVVSWGVTSVTEIMTIGFGDLIPQLRKQNSRFTEEGWDSFVAAFHKQNIAQLFKGHELVLTTVPSDTAVILGQGVGKEGIYEWKVQVPVIMTYETNDNRTDRRKAIVTLTITRVPSTRSPTGIAIKNLLVE